MIKTLKPFFSFFSVVTLTACGLLLNALQPEAVKAQQIQCSNQFGANNIANQIQNSIFSGGVIPLYQNQCLGQLGVGNVAGQYQGQGLIPGNYVIPTVPGSQGLLQLGDNNWALQQNLNLILPPGGGLNISNAEANPTIINSNTNTNYFIGR